jgi:hypothetical protein
VSRRFTVTYTPDQAADPLINPDAIVATAVQQDGIGLLVERRDDYTVDFMVGSGTDAEVDHLLIRLRRHSLAVTEGSQR